MCENILSNKKYNRTFHVSFTEEKHLDDKTMNGVFENNLLNNKEIVISIKLDGGNCCLSSEGVFARTHSVQTSCPSFNYIKNIHYFPKKHLLNPNYKYFGENMYAKHSIEYNELTDYFYLFNILDLEKNEWLSLKELQDEAKRLDFKVVPIVFIGKSDKKSIQKLIQNDIMIMKFFGGECEGVVIRSVERFSDETWNENICKFVRKGHVQTDEHWNKNWVKNNILNVWL